MIKALIAGSLLCASVFVPVYAQKSPIKYGDIPLEDLKMTSYAKDSSASAVVLVDYGEAYLQVNINTATLNFERHVRIKILKKEGLEWADAKINLFKSGSAEERVTNLKASTYNLEGGKVVQSSMSKDAVFKEKFNNYINIQKFSLPNVKEGSVIEYSYTVVSEFFTEFPNWQFQYTIPVRWSEYWAIIPEFFMYERYMQGYIMVNTYETKSKGTNDYQATGHHWICKDVPAFKEEPHMTNEDDYVSKINFALSYIKYPNKPLEEIMGSWQKLNDGLLESESFGKAITGSNFLKKQVEAMTAGMTDPQKKIDTIYNYVKQTLEWDGTKDMLAGNLKKIVEVKKGTAADINIVLASMLEKADLNVEMVLLSTRDHGFIRQSYPMTKQFNYVICGVRLNDKLILLDATEKFLPIDALPERCLNGEGMVVSRTHHGWINIESKTKARTVINADLAVNEAGELKGKLHFIRDGYDAQRMRENYKSKGHETYVKDFSSGKSWQIEKTEFQNMPLIKQSAKELHDVIISDHASVAGNQIYINPFVISQMETNPFKLEKREYPVDFGTKVEKMYMFKMAMPAGYDADELPASKIFALPGNAGRYSYNVSKTGNVINVISTLQINKSLFSQDEYSALREFYNLVVAKQNEQIVLKKLN